MIFFLFIFISILIILLIIYYYIVIVFHEFNIIIKYVCYSIMFWFNLYSDS